VKSLNLGLSFQTVRRLSNLFLPLLLASGLPCPVIATVSANLNWVASSNPQVTGYNIYYGAANQQLSGVVSLGAVTNAVISGLAENTTYFFAAKAVDGTGDESAFSNEAGFLGARATPLGGLRLRALPKNYSSDPLEFSLDASAPAGASINPTNGMLCWIPGHACASSTNFFTVHVTDTANGALNISETVMVIVSDYLEFQMGATAVYAGQSASLPLMVNASGSLTNVQLTLNWPANQLLNPTLSLVPPVVAGVIQPQNGQLVVQLQTAANQPLTGSNLLAQVNFQAASNQTSTVILGVPVSAAAGVTAAGTTYANASGQAGEVVVVGTQPLLRPQASASARNLTLYANPGNYELLYTTSLVAPVTWAPALMYQQTNAAQTVSLDPTIPCVFYRFQPL
jgi:hypothetical protein